jgi:hypothetical protein
MFSLRVEGLWDDPHESNSKTAQCRTFFGVPPSSKDMSAIQAACPTIRVLRESDLLKG